MHLSQMMGKSLPMKVRSLKESKNSTKHAINKGQLLCNFSRERLNLKTCGNQIIALSDAYL